jgi:hypothetical protein
MRTRFMQSASLLLLAATVSGCSSTKRFVTTKTWFGGDTLFVAYTEQKTGFMSSSFEAKVLSCKRGTDNGLVCSDQAEINRFLNTENNNAATP